MFSIKHLFHTPKADGPDSTLVKPSNWNEDHDVQTTTTVPIVLGRTTPGAGPIEELPISVLFPPGAVISYAGAAAPPGWLLCYGQALNQVDFPTLFAAIGTTYGAGPGPATFQVPDLRGVTAGGKSNMGGADRGNLPGGAVLGQYLGAPSVGGLPVSVSGTLNGSTSGAQYFAGTFGTDGGDQVQYGGITGSGDVAHGYHQHNVSVAGWTQGQALNVVASGSLAGGTTVGFGIIQPTVVLNKIIKT